uniref:Mos1 transposase HTH domain-containing protein n=1 Tax=Pseudonaja textilis TaxID=8673 RepID=A0A670Z1V8_PSETE
MCAAIENPASCEVRSVIRFLLAETHKPIEIFQQLCEVYGDNIITEGGVRQWYIKFKNGRTKVHDEQRSGYPSIVTDELVAKVDDKIRENRRFTVTELSLSFPQISRSLLHEIVTQKLGYHKFCARWVPKIPSENHKNQCMAASLTFLYSYDKDGDSFLDRIITGDETWVKHVSSETKLQSMQGVAIPLDPPGNFPLLHHPTRVVLVLIGTLQQVSLGKTVHDCGLRSDSDEEQTGSPSVAHTQSSRWALWHVLWP